MFCFFFFFFSPGLILLSPVFLRNEQQIAQKRTGGKVVSHLCVSALAVTARTKDQSETSNFFICLHTHELSLCFR
uniref:Putative secreted protein n=1 Tax=Rhipicephalus microplus TaxID=6941 RepID=A0A6M2DAU0_RHIMP